jgi:hypothetical protein
LLRLPPLVTRGPAADDGHLLPGQEDLPQPLLEILQRVAVLGEDDDLAPPTPLVGHVGTGQQPRERVPRRHRHRHQPVLGLEGRHHIVAPLLGRLTV